MNKDVFSGFIQGVVAMFKQTNKLHPLLEMRWDIQIVGQQCKVSCEYNTFICDKLVEVGDYDTPPEYETIRERNTIDFLCPISNNLTTMAEGVYNLLLTLETINPDEI